MAAVHWFRHGLRLHDNAALLAALAHTASKSGSSAFYAVYVLEPGAVAATAMGAGAAYGVSVNRAQFLLDCLADVDARLRAVLGPRARLRVLRGRAAEVLPRQCAAWGATLVTWETQRHCSARDADVATALGAMGVRVAEHGTHTLFDVDDYLLAAMTLNTGAGHGGPPLTYAAFCRLFAAMGRVRTPLPAPTRPVSSQEAVEAEDEDPEQHALPNLAEFGYHAASATTPFRGGETEALRRLAATVTARPQWVATFAKPATSPNAVDAPSTTVLSPYLATGCLSAATLYHELAHIYAAHAGAHTQPPVSLQGQLLWREFFWLTAATTPQFDRMVGNPHCRQIAWDAAAADDPMLAAWAEARTGYPFIDAVMTQLRVEGWIHHLARHAVACFLTRGDLWQSWEAGVRVFDQLLLDDDWALNNANWQWLSCSRFFAQYFRVYSPVAFGRKTDPTGAYIRRWLPQLAGFPDRYIYEPHTAPAAVQAAAGCRIGTDYPAPIVDHAVVQPRNLLRMRAAFAGEDAQDDEMKAARGVGPGKVATVKATMAKATRGVGVGKATRGVGTGKAMRGAGGAGSLDRYTVRPAGP